MHKQALCRSIAIAVLGIMPALADIPGGAKPQPPVSNFRGESYAQWSVRWWLWDFSLPAPDNPTISSAPCANGQSGNTWYLYGGPAAVSCSVQPGTAIFLPVANVECSSLESPPFYGATPADRAACAKAWVDNLTNVSATIDGVPVQNLSAFRVQTGDFPFSVPADNVIGVAGPASGYSSGDGYYLMLNPFSHGTHTIHITGTFHDPSNPSQVVFALDTTITLTVAQH